MHLHAARNLAAEVPGFSQEQLDRLARSVELRRQQLEEDINAYIQGKQEELRQYEHQVCPPLCPLFAAPALQLHAFLRPRPRFRLLGRD